MEKIPTLFERKSPKSLVTSEVHPGCMPVLWGLWTPRRKWDGVGVRLAPDGLWQVRARFRPNETLPTDFTLVYTNDFGSRWGWRTARSGIYAPPLDEALRGLVEPVPGTYELVGPGLGGGSHVGDRYELHRHNDAPRIEELSFGRRLSRILLSDFFVENLRPRGIEGIVWYGPDERRAKLKVTDFRRR